MEARHCASELEQTLGAPVFLDSDDLTDLRELLEQVRESDVLLFFQSRSVLERPYCLLELHTAVTAGVPIVAVNVRGGTTSACSSASLRKEAQDASFWRRWQLICTSQHCLAPQGCPVQGG